MNPDKFTLSDMAMLCYNIRNMFKFYSQQFLILLTIFCCVETLSAQSSFYVSSNTQQTVGVFDISTDGNIITASTFANITSDADGIYYDEAADVLYQLNRTNGAVAAYSNVRKGGIPNLTAMSAAETINGREMAVSGNRLVVAQDANDANGNQNRLIVFDISPTAITLLARYDVDFNLWGIHVDGETLYAIEDNSNRLAIFNNFFFLPEGKINPTRTIAVEGIIRTHGLTYVSDKDMMILTDVGAGSNSEDGAFTVVQNFKTAAVDGIIMASEQIRVVGANTLLGNPVDIAFDPNGEMIYVAERANGGGRVLGFALPTIGGDIEPTYDFDFAGASAIHLPGTENFTESMATRLAQLFVSSNTQQNVGVYNIWNDNTIAIDRFNNATQDADGIYYDRDNDALYQLNRMNNSINAYSNVNSNIQQGMMPTLTATSSAEFSNGREIAISGDKLVVAQDGNEANGNQNQFVWYSYTPTGFTFIDRLEVDFNLWGIHADGSTLYAIEDNSNRLAIFEDFFNQTEADIQIPFFVEIEGIIRTHGLTYIANRDMMILTDVGAGTNPEDGAFTIIKNFKVASADGLVDLNEQIRVQGDATFLGNPVDVAFEPDEMMIYIAERANNGGRVLGFAMPAMSGNYMPTYNDLFAGASAVYLSSDNGIGSPNPSTPDVADRFFVSSNTQRVIATYNIQADNSIMKQQFVNANMDADGIYYDKSSDILYQVNRTGSAVNSYTGVNAALKAGNMPQISGSSAAEFSNGRELAVSGDWLVVAQDGNEANGNQNSLVIFDKNTLVLRNKIDVGFNLWGIHAEGSTLYAIEDNSNRLRVYADFFNQLDNDIQVPFEISIDGLVRTHGLTYDAGRDIMYLTDVGAASSPDDGAVIIINNFVSASSDGSINANEQIRIAGANTFLGNPVDIAYDGQRNMIFVAERANGGGRVLGFVTPTASGDFAPLYNDLHVGASAIYFADGDENNFTPPTSEIFNTNNLTTSTDRNTFNFTVYPNPANDWITLELPDLAKVTTIDIAIYDAFGKQIRQIQTTDIRQNIDIQNLVGGVYYMVVVYDEKLITQKFIKK